MSQKKTWQTTIRVPLPDGTKKQKHIRAGSPEELERKKQELRKEISQGIDVTQDDHFRTWAKRWLNTTKLNQGLSDHQIQNLQSQLTNVNRALGAFRFQQLTLYQLQTVFNEFAACNPHTGKPTSASMLRKYRYLAANIARFADASGVRGVNVSAFLAVQVPRNAPVKKRKALTPEQIGWIEQTGHPIQTFAMIATFAGLRRGEALGLQWQDLDLDQGLLHVRRTIVFYNGRAGLKDGGKTANAVRTVAIPPVLVTYLRNYRNTLPVYPAPGCFVVTDPRGNVFNESTFKRYWEDYLQTLNRRYGGFDQTDLRKDEELPWKIEPFTPHQCRHTFATLLYLEHIGVADSMSLMGHANPATTLSVYTDLKHFSRSELPSWFRKKLQTSYRITVVRDEEADVQNW